MISPTQEEEYHADDDHATDDHATDDHANTGDDDHRRRLAGGGTDTPDVYSNTGSDGELMFIVAGWLMLALAVGNCLMSRWVELRLLKKAGCKGTKEYAERLTVIEKQTLEAKVSYRTISRFGRVTLRRRVGGITFSSVQRACVPCTYLPCCRPRGPVVLRPSDRPCAAIETLMFLWLFFPSVHRLSARGE